MTVADGLLLRSWRSWSSATVTADAMASRDRMPDGGLEVCRDCGRRAAAVRDVAVLTLCVMSPCCTPCDLRRAADVRDVGMLAVLVRTRSLGVLCGERSNTRSVYTLPR